MAHYAFVDENNIVVEVITGVDEDVIINDITDWEEFYTAQRDGLRALRTSYNTKAGQHLNGGTPFRGNYATIGSYYDERLDAFILPKPFESWILNESNYSWEAPVPYPEDGEFYFWTEETTSWDPAVPKS